MRYYKGIYPHRKDVSEEVKNWLVSISVWNSEGYEDLRRCLNYYIREENRSLDDYISAIHVLREAEQDLTNKQRLEQYKIKMRLYRDELIPATRPN